MTSISPAPAEHRRALPHAHRDGRSAHTKTNTTSNKSVPGAERRGRAMKQCSNFLHNSLWT